jgi:hypothetical protein
MTSTDLSTFLTSQVTVVAGLFLAGFGAVYGIALVRGAITKHSAKLARQV